MARPRLDEDRRQAIDLGAEPETHDELRYAIERMLMRYSSHHTTPQRLYEALAAVNRAGWEFGAVVQVYEEEEFMRTLGEPY